MMLIAFGALVSTWMGQCLQQIWVFLGISDAPDNRWLRETKITGHVMGKWLYNVGSPELETGAGH